MNPPKIRIYLGAKTIQLIQGRTPTGLPRCIMCGELVPMNSGHRHQQGRFCTDRCCHVWAHSMLDNMADAELWEEEDRRDEEDDDEPHGYTQDGEGCGMVP